MERPAALRRGEKWIIALTLAFSLLMVGVCLCSTHFAAESGYTVRVGDLAAEDDPMEATQWQVNINTATAEELVGLPGVGEELAKRIVVYRMTHGPYRSAEELLAVEGIGSSKLEEIRELIVLEEEAEK